MSSWFNPRQLDDASRVLRGIALVMSHKVYESPIVKRAAAGDYQKTMNHIADLLSQEARRAEPVHQSPAQGPPSAHDTSPGHATAQHQPPAGQAPSIVEEIARGHATAQTQPQPPLGQAPSLVQDIAQGHTTAQTQAPPEQQAPTQSYSAPQPVSSPVSMPASSPHPAASLATSDMTASKPGPVNSASLSAPPPDPAKPDSSPMQTAIPPVPPAPPVQPVQPAPKHRVLRERRVPESPMGRALGFAGLGASLMFGSMQDNMVRVWSGPVEGETPGSSGRLTAANATRLADALCRMRGAALKIGQMLSIQDENVLPPQVQAALERVRQGADVMPRHQLEGVLRKELGEDWLSLVAEFDHDPKAAATKLHDGREIAMKIQYPGVARSIESDVDNIMRLISIANVLPRGMYAENAIRVAKKELSLECDYRHELAAQRRFKKLVANDPELTANYMLSLECDYRHELAAQRRFKELVANDPELAGKVYVPAVIPELSSTFIISSEWVQGVSIDKVRLLSQETRDEVGTLLLLRITLKELFESASFRKKPGTKLAPSFCASHSRSCLKTRDEVGTLLLRITLKELFEWAFMQTDPNWGNFLYDADTNQLNLIDFGAAREYPQAFVDEYLQMVEGCARRDSQKVVEQSCKLGFLTGGLEVHS
eukprot:gene5783-6006_t